MLVPGALLQNRYRIVRLGQRNPSNSVYDAVDERFGSTVIVKEWAPGGADASRDAFAREAMLLNKYYHPALAHVFDTFVEGGILYVIAQYVNGESLASLLERGERVEVSVALGWADRLLDVLEFLHGLEPPIVHANVAPAAIRVTPNGDIVLMDFSLCVESGSKPIAYTPPYAPHEQVQGLHIDELVDIYGLSATLYHVLAGEAPPNPFERMSNWSGGGPVLLRPVDQINPEVPPAIALALQTGLSLRHEDRVGAATALRLALYAAVAPLPSVTAPVLSSAPTEAVLSHPNAPTAPVTTDSKAPTERIVASAAQTEAVASAASAPTVAFDPRASITEKFSAPPPSSSTSVICRTCGSSNDPDRLFCPFCGSVLRVGAAVEADPSGVVDDHGHDAVLETIVDTVVDDMVDDDAVDEDTAEAQTDDDTAEAPTEALASIDEGGLPTLVPPKPLLAQLLVLEGEEPGKVLPLEPGETAFGRAEGTHTFPLDIFMSGRHARIVRAGDRFGIRDVGSRNGTFLKIRGETPLRSGDVILAGKQLLRFDPDDESRRACLRLLLETGAIGDSFVLNRDETTIGRTKGDITFGQDTAMADAHAKVLARDGGFVVADLGSKNGTFLRVSSEAVLFDGDIVIFGKHIFRFEISEWQDDYSTLKGF